MAAAYGSVKQCGGYVSVSTVEAGTCFAIYLPSAEHFVAPLEERRGGPSTATETIVLVEEEEGTRNLVRNLLARKGYRILEAQEEADIRRIFAEFSGSIHLLIANVKASRLAYDIAQKHSNLKLIYISGSPDDTADDYSGPLPLDAALLQKPFRLDTLLAKIRSVLDNKPSVG